MILKKQLLNQTNLNAAFVSKTDTNEQTIASNLKLAGKVTLKTGGSFISDNENATYMQIDAQGNHVVLYDGVNNQKLSVYASNGTKATYITSLDTENYGLIDVTSGLDHIEIGTNTTKYTKFGGYVVIRTAKSLQFTDGTNTASVMSVYGMDASNAGLIVGGGGTTIVGGGESATTAMPQYAYTNEHLVLTADQNIYFHSNLHTAWSSNVGMVWNTNGRLGINNLSPSEAVDINGNIKLVGSLNAYGQRMFSSSLSLRNAPGVIEEVNSAPMYGIGFSDLLQVGNTGSQYSVQVGGNYGVNIKTANNELRIGYQNNTNGILFNGNQVWHAGNHGNSGDPHTQYLSKTSGGTISGNIIIAGSITTGQSNTSTMFNMAAELDTDTRKLDIVRDSTTGKITEMYERDYSGAPVTVKSYIINRTSNRVSSIVETVGSTQVTTTFTRDSSGVTQISKSVV